MSTSTSDQPSTSEQQADAAPGPRQAVRPGFVWAGLGVTVLFVFAALAAMPALRPRSYARPKPNMPYYAPGRAAEPVPEEVIQKKTESDRLKAQEDAQALRSLAAAPPGSIRPHPVVNVAYLVLTQQEAEAIDRVLDRDFLVDEVRKIVAQERMLPYHEHLLSFLRDEERVKLERHLYKDLPLPKLSLKYLELYGKDLTEEDEATVLGARWGILVRVRTGHIPAKHPSPAVKVSHFGLLAPQLISAVLARELNGVAIDTMTEEIYSLPALQRSIINPFDPDVVKHMRIEQDDRNTGMVTLWSRGLHKLGIPELLLEDVPKPLVLPASMLLEGVAHRLLDHLSYKPGQKVHAYAPREIQVTLGDVVMANGMEDEYEFGSERSCYVRLRIYNYMDMGPRFPNAVDRVRVVPTRELEEFGQAWLLEALQQVFGNFADRTVEVSPQLRAVAQARAQKALPALKKRFLRGLGAGKELFVAAGFRLPDGRQENMWVHVEGWEGNRIRGRLASNSAHRADLRAGKPVEISERDVLDWYIQNPDGSREGEFLKQVLPKDQRKQWEQPSPLLPRPDGDDDEE